MTIEVPPDDAGKVIELMGRRRGEMTHMQIHGDLAFLEFEAPSPRPDRAAHEAHERDARQRRHDEPA